MVTAYEDDRQAARIRPLNLTAGDFNGDGAQDLAVGWGGNSGRGYVTVLNGSLGSILPVRGGELPEALAAGSSPFQPETVVYELPVSPRFLASGDIDGDGLSDLVLADAETDALWFLLADKPGFSLPQRKALPGVITALVAGEVNRPDGLADLVVGLDSGGEGIVAVLESPENAINSVPDVIAMDAPSEAVLVRDLDQDGLNDIASAALNSISVIWGRDRLLSFSEALRNSVEAPQVGRKTYAQGVQSIAVGDFVRGPGLELAVLLSGGGLEINCWSKDSGPEMVEELGAGLNETAKAGISQSANQLAVRYLLRTARLSPVPNDELIGISEATGAIVVLTLADETTLTEVDLHRSREIQMLALPMRLNQDAFDDLLLVSGPAGHLSVVLTQEDSTFTVNAAGNDFDYSQGDGICDADNSPDVQRCTLRAAIQEGNAGSSGSYRIDFGIGYVDGISTLPNMTKPVTVSGGNVILDGSASGSAPSLQFLGGNSVLQGVRLIGFGNCTFEGSNNRIEANWFGTTDGATALGARGGVVLQNASSTIIGGVSSPMGNLFMGVPFVESIQFWGAGNRDNLIQGNYIGTDSQGVGGVGNYGGIRIRDAINTTIGGAASSGNIITGSTGGSAIHASHSTGLLIQGNRIGTDSIGHTGFQNSSYGIWVEQDSESITIGGTTAELGNIVTSSKRQGIMVTDSAAVLVQGNLIGTSEDGGSALGNGRQGIWLLRESTSDPARPSAVGGVAEGAGNVISGNGWSGLGIGLYDYVEVIGNKIGTDASGSEPLPNQLIGLGLGSTDSALVKGNVIAFNGGDGIQIDWDSDAGTGNRITENAVFSNGGIGINLCPCDEDNVPAVTPNDGGDGDSGPNQLQNYPVLTAAAGTSGISGSLNSRPGSSYQIEFFASDSCDESGYGEGREYLGALSVAVDASGSGSFVFPGAPGGKAITATATDPGGNTSEFSACAGVPEKTPYVVNSSGDDPDQNASTGNFDGVCSTGKKADGSSGACNPQVEGDCECTLRAAIQESNSASGRDEIRFDIGADGGQSNAGVRVIRPGSALPDIACPVIIDGYTQSGSREASDSAPALLKIELDGANAGAGADGLVFTTSDSEVRGLTIHSFGRNGIVLKGDSNHVAGNYLGVDPTGQVIRQTESTSIQSGVWVFDSPDNLIGGTNPRDRNLIAGFAIGLQIVGPKATGNEVHGNLFCIDSKGERRIAEKICSQFGINVLQASGNIIGGKRPNIIGGTGFGIVIDGGEAAAGNKVQGNLIGTNSRDFQTGGELGNWVGILVKADNNLIGGPNPGEGNTIGNRPVFEGVSILEDELKGGVLVYENSEGNLIQGNLIQNCPDYGVRVTNGASRNLIGGPDGTFGNTITRNGVGILVDSEQSVGNRILSNRIWSNQGSGIALSNPANEYTTVFEIGPAPNDRNDLDTGPNERQNTPEFPRYDVHNESHPVVTVDPEGVVVRARLDSSPNEDFEIQFFAAYDSELYPVCEGQRYLGKRTVTSNFVGNAHIYFRFPVSQFEGMNLVTATATNSNGSTSEFARCAQVAPDSDGDGVPDGVENTGPNDGDSDSSGTPDALEKDVALIKPWYEFHGRPSAPIPIETTAAELIIETAFTPATALESYIVVSRKDRIPVGWASSTQQLTGGSPNSSVSLLQTEGFLPNQAGSSILTYHLPQELQISGFYNYGPTPDNPSEHLYEFLFDGTTGAEIFDDRIEVHYVDGARGDHDLTVNGVIETLGGPVIDSATFYFPQLGDGLAGNIQFQSSLILANVGGFSPVQIDLADSGGRFLDLEFEGLGSGSLFELGMDPGESLSTQTPGSDSLKVGYAQVVGAEGLGGTAVFSRSDAAQGILLYETGVPAVPTRSDFSLFVDSLGDRDTGLALVYPRVPGQSQEVASVTLRLYDKSFVPVGVQEVTLAPGEHLARFIRELFPDQAARASEMEGVVTVESDQDLAAVTLRQNDDPSREFPDEVPTLTAFPVIPGRADDAQLASSEVKVFYFPQVADGAVPGIALRTSMIFVNTGSSTSVRVDLFDTSGNPMALDLGTGQTAPVFEFPLSKGEALTLQSPGAGNLKVGYARVTTESQVGGTGVFTLIHAATGTLLYEAGVPAAELQTDFSLVIDSTGYRRTGVALVKTPGEPGTGSSLLTLRLYDQNFNLLKSKELDLAPGEHYARFVDEIFPEVAGITEMLGTLTVQSDGPVAAVTLRESNDPNKDFPDEVPTLSTFPVISGRGDQ